MTKSMTVASAEDLLRAIARANSHTATIPTKGHHQQAGGEAAVVQALITWAQCVDRPRIDTFLPDPQDSDGQGITLTRQFFGVAAALLCDDARALDGSSVFTGLRTAALSRLDVIQSERPRDASRGPQYEILCADHLNRASPRLLYNLDCDGEPSLKDADAFIDVAERIRGSIVPGYLSAVLPGSFAGALGGALYELFRNTEDHARVDDNGDVPSRSLRGVQARRHAVPQAKLAELTSASPPLTSFCGRLRPPRARNRDLQLLEVSVIDSGPGFAASIIGKPLASIDPVEEGEAVRRCFRKHATNKVASRSGLGLCNVIDILREHGGFLRLRTGRQSLYADLGLEAGAAYGELPELRDWTIGTPRPERAAGTLMTMLLPLVFE